MEIKIVDINDLDCLFELNKLYGNDKTKEDIENEIKTSKNKIICIAYIDNIAVGFCSGLLKQSIYNSNCGVDIREFFVKDGYGHKGIEMELVKYLEQEAISRNI